VTRVRVAVTRIPQTDDQQVDARRTGASAKELPELVQTYSFYERRKGAPPE
jgi:hypothetical protein